MRKLAAIFIFLVLALRAVVPALPMYVCAGMGAAHRWQPCCAGAEESEIPALAALCCKPEQGAAVDVALPPAKTSFFALQLPVFTAPAVALLFLPRPADARLLPAGAPPGPVGPPPPLRTILRI